MRARRRTPWRPLHRDGCPHRQGQCEQREAAEGGVGRHLVAGADVADLHVGLIARQSRVKKIVTMLAKEAPDLVLSAGDLIDSGGTQMAGLLLPSEGSITVCGLDIVVTASIGIALADPPAVPRRARGTPARASFQLPRPRQWE